MCAGRFPLELGRPPPGIESVVETVRAATESLAQKKKLTLATSVDKSHPVCGVTYAVLASEPGSCT